MKVSTTVRNFGAGLLTLFGLLALWQVIALKLNLPLILPLPKTVFLQLTNLIRDAAFWQHLGASLLRGLIGFGLSLIIGTIIGLVSGVSPIVGAICRPILVLLRSTPSMTFILLALIWFKGDLVTVFVIFLVVFPMITQNVMEGIRNIDRELLQMVTVFRLGKRRRLTALYLPSVAPYLMAGIVAGLGLTWKVLIAAEVLSYPRFGIGTQMDTARTYLETDKVFAWSIVVIMIGLVFDYVIGYLSTVPQAIRKGIRNV